jgi:type IV pilus assembly protein PilM
MARSDRILAIDIGATSIKVGEFEYPTRDTRTLVNFAHREYEEELTESTRSVVVAGLLRQMVVENNFIARRALVCMSGQSAFTRFVKLPPFSEDEKRIRQIVEFEAKQNVPFNMNEVIWDYQLIASPDEEEMDVMFVVIKNEIVEQMTGAVQAVGLEPVLVDVAPAACYNAARANHVGDDECAMVLSIGGRSTNLLFVDRTRFFARTIPIAGHSITQQIAKEFGIGFAEAEELKRRHGFVALGGAYAEPESEVAAAVSKIIRNVMARLHGEINRSVSVYRAQQHGNRPTRLYLTGGSSTMTYCDHFFAEKLHLEVVYFNPFQVVGLGPSVDRQRLQEVAHMFSEVIGLGLRYRLPCPIEVTLVPETIRRQQALRRKKPFVFASLACLLVILLVAWFSFLNRGRLYAKAVKSVEDQRQRVESFANKIKSYNSETDQRKNQISAITDLLRQRCRWPNVYNELYRLKPDNLWLHSIQPVLNEMAPINASADAGSGMMGGPGGGGGGAFPGGGGGAFPGGRPGAMPGGMPGGDLPGGDGGGGGGGGGGGAFPGGGGGGGAFPGGLPGGMPGVGGVPGGDGMMGGPGGGMLGGGSGGIPTPTAVPIAGLIISGHGVILGTANAAEAINKAASELREKEGAASPVPTPAPAGAVADTEKTDKADAPADADKTAQAADAPADAATEADAEAPAEELTPEQRRAQAIERASQQATPELAFLELLKASDLFDPDGEFTGIVSYVAPQNIDNLSTFVIQIKFKEPFEVNLIGR